MHARRIRGATAQLLVAGTVAAVMQRSAMITAVRETADLQARKLPGLLSMDFRWPGKVVAWRETDNAPVGLRLAAAAWMIGGGRAARSGGVDRCAPLVPHG